MPCVLSVDLGIRNFGIIKADVEGNEVTTLHHASVHDIVLEAGCGAKNCKTVSLDRLVGFLSDCLAGLEADLLADPMPTQIVCEAQPGRKYAALSAATLMWASLRLPRGSNLRLMAPLAKFKCVPGGHARVKGHAALKKRSIECARALLPDGELDGDLLNDHLADCVLQAVSVTLGAKRRKVAPIK